MELRKDPITRSWVVLGRPEPALEGPGGCPVCAQNSQVASPLLELPQGNNWQVRVYPHPQPLCRIEGEVARTADGMFDHMKAVGAHEVICESPIHNRKLEQLNDAEIERVLEAYALRIADLKRDARFKYVAVCKDQRSARSDECPHPYSELTATTFVPRRILDELRAARDWYRQRERCVFCDILRQEIRQKRRIVDKAGDYYAFCPYASRVPYELWLIPQTHHHQFEAGRENRRQLASLLGRSLRRISQIATRYQMAIHTAPNTLQTKGELSDYWATIAGDYHWHIEVLPIVDGNNKSHSVEEVYFNSQLPEEAADQLRNLDPTKC
jgi:UDPglucose--hexose-1-phosphate uridylyltransferase